MNALELIATNRHLRTMAYMLVLAAVLSGATALVDAIRWW